MGTVMIMTGGTGGPVFPAPALSNAERILAQACLEEAKT